MITLGALSEDTGVRHAFFTRQGGVSEGAFASLNCGYGAGDSQDNVARNRGLAMQLLAADPERLVSCRQAHTAEAVVVERPWRRGEAPRADGLATRIPGVALGILAADCAPVLFADPAGGVVGAAHAGWRGALGGILEATIRAMQHLGAEPSRICAGIGPCIGPASYEVGPEFEQEFVAADPDNRQFFAAARQGGKFLFDLAGYIERRLARCGIGAVTCARRDTVAEEAHFFSYRRARRRGEAEYGRGLSAIVLAE